MFPSNIEYYNEFEHFQLYRGPLSCLLGPGCSRTRKFREMSIEYREFSRPNVCSAYSSLTNHDFHEFHGVFSRMRLGSGDSFHAWSSATNVVAHACTLLRIAAEILQTAQSFRVSLDSMSPKLTKNVLSTNQQKICALTAGSCVCNSEVSSSYIKQI